MTESSTQTSLRPGGSSGSAEEGARGRQWLRKLAISLGSLLGMLGVLEIGVRIFMPQDPAFWDDRAFQRVSASPPYLPENIPHGYNKNYIGVPVRMNSYGLRGEEIQVPKPPHTIRIIGVGDSITLGFGIRLEDTYLKVLERKLNETATRGTLYEVLNAGVTGTGLDYYYHFLATRAPLLEPDVALIGLCLNDIAAYQDLSARKPPSPSQQKESVVRRISDFLLEHSQLYMASYLKLKSILYGMGILDINKLHEYDFLALEPPSPKQEKAWDSSFKLLSKIVELSRQGHYRLVIVVFPMEMQISPSVLQLYRNRLHVRLGDEALSGEPQRRIKEFASAQGITVVDLLRMFRTLGPSKLYLRNVAISLDPVHPSILGNRIAGEEIFRVLEAKLLGSTTETPGDSRGNPPRQP